MKRNLKKSIKKDLLKSDLWRKNIENECINENVFCAIRNNIVDFYYKGGRLFKYDKNGFKTHIKYASVIKSKGKSYLGESDLKNFNLASDFDQNYERIKENCKNYSGLEALGISEIYHKKSYLTTNNIVVLDIEVSFVGLTNDVTNDRIDILLYNKKTSTLQFIEAKHYSNGEIWSRTTPKVINQIKKYEQQIHQKKKKIISEYTKYIKAINSIFGINLPFPSFIDPKVTLLVFGFDRDQSKGKLKRLIINNKAYQGIKSYQIGDTKNIKMKNLWNASILG